MDKDEARELIHLAGGVTAFAELIGIKGEPGWYQRVYAWTRRGMPAQVVLDNLAKIVSLQRRAGGNG